MQRVKDWLIRSLGGLTWKDHLDDMEWFREVYLDLRERAAINSKMANEQMLRANMAEGELRRLKRRVVTLRAEHREAMPRMAHVPNEEIERWFTDALTRQLADGLRGHAKIETRNDMHLYEIVWRAEVQVLDMRGE